MSPESRQLRNWLAEPAHRVTAADPVERHREALMQIWQKGLELAHGDGLVALAICVDAVRTNRMPGDPASGPIPALGGVPSKAFGDRDPYAGVDKPQHFFASAQIAYAGAVSAGDGLDRPSLGNQAYGSVLSDIAGLLYEAKDAFSKMFGKNSGGYDRGDIFADRCGSAFGAWYAGSGGPLLNFADKAPPDDILLFLGLNGAEPRYPSQLSPPNDGNGPDARVQPPDGVPQKTPAPGQADYDDPDATMTGSDGNAVRAPEPTAPEKPSADLQFSPIDADQCLSDAGLPEAGTIPLDPNSTGALEVHDLPVFDGDFAVLYDDPTFAGSDAPDFGLIGMDAAGLGAAGGWCGTDALAEGAVIQDFGVEVTGFVDQTVGDAGFAGIDFGVDLGMVGDGVFGVAVDTISPDFAVIADAGDVGVGLDGFAGGFDGGGGPIPAADSG